MNKAALALSIVLLLSASQALASPKQGYNRGYGNTPRNNANNYWSLEQKEQQLRAEKDRLEHLQDVANKHGGRKGEQIKDRLEQRQDRIDDQIKQINYRQDQIRSSYQNNYDNRNYGFPRGNGNNYGNGYGNWNRNGNHNHPPRYWNNNYNNYSNGQSDCRDGGSHGWQRR